MKIDSQQIIAKYLDRELVDRFVAEVVFANKKFNLYSRQIDHEELLVLIAESLVPIEAGWVPDGKFRALDIGSGWGIPAIPIVMARPQAVYSLVERSERKAGFLSLMMNRLGIKAEVAATDLGNFRSTGKFDLVTVRQVAISKKVRAQIRDLINRAAPVIKFGGSDKDIEIPGQAIVYKMDNRPEQTLTSLKIF